MKDNISDMLTRIRNGQKASLLEVLLFWPTPSICLKILIVLQREGFIRGFKKVFVNDKQYICVLLKYTTFQMPLITKIERISKPGKRVYCRVNNFWKINNGKGIFIISTPKGLMTEMHARQLSLGGEILCYIE